MADLTTEVRIAILDAFSAPLNKFGLQLTGVEGKAKKLEDAFARHTRLAGELNQAAEGMGRFSDTVFGLVKAPVDEFREFEHQIAKVGAVGDLTAQDMATLEKQALDLGAATRYSATEAALAQENLVSAGYDVNAIMKLTPVSLELATAADLSLARASDILTGSLAAFGFEASQAGHAADVLATGAAVSKANVEYLSEVTAKAGPIAKTLGISLETVAAAGAAFADAQIEAAVGGTALKTVLLRLAAPAKMGEKAFAQLGLSGQKFKDMQAELGKGNLPGVLQTIGKSFDKLGLTAVQRVDKLKHIFGDEAAAQASVLIEAAMRVDDKGLVQLRTAFEKADGASAKMAKRMDNDTTGAITRMESAFSGLNIALGRTLAPTVQSLAGLAGDSASGLAKLAEEYPDATKASLELVGALAGLSLGLKGVLLAQSAYHGGLAALGKTYTAMSGSLLGKVGLVAAVGLAAYAIGTWANETFGLADKFSSALGRSGPEQNKDFKGQEEYDDGTVLDQHGNVVRLATKQGVRAPKEVRLAQEAGARTPEEISNFIRARRAERARENFSVNQTPLAAPEGRSFNAVTGRLEQSPTTRAIVDALREQTRATERNEKATRDVHQELRRRAAPPAAPMPVGGF